MGKDGLGGTDFPDSFEDEEQKKKEKRQMTQKKDDTTVNAIMSFRRLVKPEDLNPANTLFGGRMLQWADEAAAMYAMCQMDRQQIVTLKVSEVLFKQPAKSGDVLEFWCRVTKKGRTSLTVKLEVNKKEIPKKIGSMNVMFDCEFIFVAVDNDGKSVPFQWSQE